MTANDFYKKLTPFYYLIYPDWDKSIERQASQLNSIITEYWGGGIHTVLDVSCGIGTQALGLAQLDYQVTASDLSEAEVERARQEAQERALEIPFSVADMRQAFTHHQRQFDLVISCDNSVPHLLNDDDILQAFQQFFKCTRPGGGVIITVRDYDKEERSGTQVKPYGIRVKDRKRYLIFQVWDFDGDIYDISMYFISDDGEAECVTHVMRSKYYAVGTGKLMSILEQTGFVDVERLDGRFFQPVIIGKKRE